MCVLHVLPKLYREGGGPVRSCQGLVAALRKAGVDAWLMSLSPGEEPWVPGVEKFVNGEPFETTLQEVQPDIVHLHGIWDPELHRCAVLCRRWGIPYVVAPRGMLEPWSLKQKWLKKRIARFLYQDRDLKKAKMLHATAESEAAQFRKLGFENHCVVSPNGVNVPEWLPCRNGEGEKKCLRALFVSRMHPKKGVLELVESWARVFRDEVEEVGGQRWVCELVYTLNDEVERSYEAQVKAKVSELGLTDQFIFTGALSDAKKWEAYARANLFVLPTYSENFGIVVAEALYAGVPVITTKGTPWKDLEDSRCGWWIDLPKGGGEAKGQRSDVGQWTALDSALREACGAQGLSALPEMGRRGRALVEEKYLWSAVVKPLVRGYEQVLGVRSPGVTRGGAEWDHS